MSDQSGALQRILYVEDDEAIRAVAQLALELVGGFELKSCESGSEALAAVNGPAPFVPDLILLDVMMPQMDGPAVLEALRALELTRATPAIFMTAKVQPAEVAHFKSLGALGVIPKPFDPMTLAASVREMWAAGHG
ncbi:MAG TPA: response regulator [Burkholderiaceae bacterium]